MVPSYQDTDCNTFKCWTLRFDIHDRVDVAPWHCLHTWLHISDLIDYNYTTQLIKHSTTLRDRPKISQEYWGGIYMDACIQLSWCCYSINLSHQTCNYYSQQCNKTRALELLNMDIASNTTAVAVVGCGCSSATEEVASRSELPVVSHILCMHARRLTVLPIASYP